MSLNSHVAMKNINKGTSKFMYFIVLHGIAQIPVWKAQNQARNRLKRKCIRHYKVYVRKRSSSNYSGRQTQNRVLNDINLKLWLMIMLIIDDPTAIHIFFLMNEWFCQGRRGGLLEPPPP